MDTTQILNFARKHSTIVSIIASIAITGSIIMPMFQWLSHLMLHILTIGMLSDTVENFILFLPNLTVSLFSFYKLYQVIREFIMKNAYNQS